MVYFGIISSRSLARIREDKSVYMHVRKYIYSYNVVISYSYSVHT